MNLVTDLDLLTVVFCVATRVRDGEDHGAGVLVSGLVKGILEQEVKGQRFQSRFYCSCS